MNRSLPPFQQDNDSVKIQQLLFLFTHKSVKQHQSKFQNSWSNQREKFLSKVSDTRAIYETNDLHEKKKSPLWENIKEAKPIGSAEGSYLNFSEGTAPKGISHTGQHSISSSTNFLFMHFLQTAKRVLKIKFFSKSQLTQYLKENSEKIMHVKYTADIHTKEKMSKLCNMKHRLENSNTHHLDYRKFGCIHDSFN